MNIKSTKDHNCLQNFGGSEAITSLNTKLAQFKASLSESELSELEQLFHATKQSSANQKEHDLGASLSHTKTQQYTPQVGQSGKDVIWVPTPKALVDRMLFMAKVMPNDYLIDLGSGDGRIPISAVQNFGALAALGIEYNIDMVKLSRERAQDAGVQEAVEFRHGDILSSDFSKATVVTMFLTQRLNVMLRPMFLKLKQGTRLISHFHDMLDWVPDEISYVNDTRCYLWIVPENVQGSWNITYIGNKLSGLNSLNIRQCFQKIEGEATFINESISLQDAPLHGNKIKFTISNLQGYRHNFDALINANSLAGTVSLQGINKETSNDETSFEAVRISG
jgi:Methyltransferase domain